MTVEIGTAIVSYIEPHPGQARAFNEWYERDHFPATVLAGPGVFGGARFVATRACKALRPPGRLFGDPARGSYLAIAWVLPGHQAEWDAWVAHEMATLVAENRMFAGRDHLHTAVYRYGWEAGAELAITALARGFPGVIVRADPDPASRIEGAVTVGLRLERTILSEAAPGPHELQIAFCAGDPCAAFASTPTASAGFASPFLATIPGTDAYTEDAS
jgi:hypothetical protein